MLITLVPSPTTCTELAERSTKFHSSDGFPFLQDFKMLIRVHEESFVLFFFNSFILLDKKPFFIASFVAISAFFLFAFMGNKLLKGDDTSAFLKG